MTNPSIRGCVAAAIGALMLTTTACSVLPAETAGEEFGSGTGLHCHHGQLAVVVEQGTLTQYTDAHHGGVNVYRVGDSIVEGARYVHETVNEGPDNLVLTVTHVTPEGMPAEQRDLTQCVQ